MRRRRRGVTLLELLTSVSAGVVIVGGILAMLLVSQISSAETMTISRVEYAAKLSALKIQHEVLDSGVGSPGWSLPDGAAADQLTFSRCLGPHDGRRAWSSPITYRQQGDLILREAEGAQTVLSADIQSLRFSLSGGVLRVTVTAQGTHRDRYFYNTTCSLDMVPRN